jgi:signal transduction histidine kinase
LEPARIAQTERLAALGTLAAGVAHEVNNPLTYVLLHLTHAARTLPRIATPQNQATIDELQSFVSGALEGVERIRSITSSIRAFARLDDFARTPLDVRLPIEAAVKLLANELHHRATLVRDFHPAPFVAASEGRLAQVFLNLIDNAIQALPETVGVVEQIRVTTGTLANGHALVEVSDTGPGIPEHLLNRIFEPFFSTKPVGHGTGLGLSISQGIVASLGGEITVSSELGRGTSFRVTLPPAKATPAIEH